MIEYLALIELVRYDRKKASGLKTYICERQRVPYPAGWSLRSRLVPEQQDA